jgi:hypothetical protein
VKVKPGTCPPSPGFFERIKPEKRLKITTTKITRINFAGARKEDN